jgi:hypothetical protein
MVTLALTMIMMAMFASIFKIAGDFVTRQKGIGENDQTARILTTVLKTDLQARSLKYLAPYHPNMSALPYDTTNLGYFYYSENNPLDDTDDVLQFTVFTQFLPSNNPNDNGELYGLATNLPLPWQASTAYAANALVRPAGTTASSQPTGYIYKNLGTALTSGGTEPSWDTGTPTLGATISDGTGTWTTVASAIDQPDGDDGLISYNTGGETINPANANPNNTGASQSAEVAYFLRHGNLIRRVLLIRNPYNQGGLTSSSQPLDTAGMNLILGPYPPAGYANNFWTDFDYAARINLGASPGVQFLATSSPETSLANFNPGSLPIGRPDNRFGFDQVYNTTGPGPTANGAPREYALPSTYNSGTNTVTITSTTPVFFGRYTAEETSNLAFLFPGALPQVGGTGVSPMGSGATLGLDSNSYTMFLLNANPPTAFVGFGGGPRRGEDIIATNVISFDVKIWDNNYSESTGSDVNRNGIIDAGPAFADVGHTATTGDFQQANNIFPAYGPNLQTGYAVPGGGVWAPPYTYTSNGATYNYNNVFDTWYRYFDFDNLTRQYDAAYPTTGLPSTYAPAPYRPRAPGSIPWAASTAYVAGQLVYSASPANPATGDTANGNVYLCKTGGTSGTTNPFALSDQVNTTTITDGGVTWTVQSPAAVQAIQITIKYLDPSQNLLRQVTIVQSLTQ